MKNKLISLAVLASLCGCAAQNPLRLNEEGEASKALEAARSQDRDNQARSEIEAVKRSLEASAPRPVKPKVSEFRFNLAIKDLPAASAYQTIAENANLNVIVSPDVKELVSINLKEVTMREALEAMRDAYGYEFELSGRKLLVGKPKVQNKVFQIDYLVGNRSAKSELKVSSSGVGEGGASASSGGSSNGAGAAAGRTANDGSKITTTVQNDFWVVLDTVLKSIISGKDGQEVVINPLSGLVYVKAWPSQLRDVEHYLERTQGKVARQVVLEAKIIEVTLSKGAQGGINWSSFDSGGNHRFSIGANPAAVYPQGGGFVSPTALGGSTGFLNGSLPSATGLGFAFTGTSFAALMSFLQSQGETQVLSAPRVATLNNQNAILKVGTDEFHVTSITTTSTSSGSSTTTTPSINVSPFFSGIALDVTPQIDDDGYVMLRVHPSVSNVSDKDKVINLGSMGVYKLPLASSSINESDTIVRVLDGDIVAIGGLMSSTLVKSGQRIPLVGDVPVVGELFKQHNDSYQKTELVILIKPTVINKPSDWGSSGFSGAAK